MSYDNLYGGMPPHVNTDTSIAAAISMLETATSIRADVYRRIASLGARGATCDGIERATGLRHQTASARVRELYLQGAIFNSGERRRTSSGRFAIVWRAVQQAPRMRTRPAR